MNDLHLFGTMYSQIADADLMMERQMFLINRFNLVYNARKGNQFILNELKGSIMDDGFLDIRFHTEPLKDGTFLSSVSILSINAEFVEWARQEQEAMDKALKKTVDYLADLSAFIVNFKKLYVNPAHNNKYCIVNTLMREHSKLFTFQTIGLEGPASQFKSTIALTHLKNFTNTSPIRRDSMEAVVNEAMAYIRRLALGVTENFNPSQPLLSVAPMPF